MQIVLGLDADGPAWPATTTGRAAEAGGLVTGPAGLLRVVEAALGLGRPDTPAVRRLAHWRAKLAAADGPERFWHRSFVTDPFATARLLLQWRDSLVEAGWHAMLLTDPPARLADLASAEAAGPALPAGQADRLRLAIEALREAPPPEPIIARLRLLDPPNLLPPGLLALVEALGHTGTDVVEEPPPLTAATGNLGAVQGVLNGLGAAEIGSDGSFTLLEADTESAAAEVVADYLAALPGQDELVIVATKPTGLLDAALRRRHLPRLGIGGRSPLRGLLQVLPLAFAIRWRPFDARRLLEMLQLPRCPIPSEVRRQLLRILPDAPGRGGAAWREAIATGLQAHRDRLAAENPDRASARMAEAEEAVATWLEAEPVDPETGLPIADLLRACAALAHWAQRQAAAGVPLAASLAAHALALAEAAREAGIATVPRLDLERLLDAILAEGEADPEAPAEATGWGIAAAPGAVWAPAPRLLWWGFDAPGLPSALPWSDVEQAALREAGCLPWKPEVALAATAMAWRRPLLAARHAAVLVAIRPVGAEAHPLAHELAPLLEPNPALRPRAEALLMAEAPTLAGVTLPRAPAETLALPVARAEWQGGVAVPVRRPRDSATAIEALLGCPFGWTMQHRAKLQPGRFAEIAQDERLIGLLAHALAAELLPAGTTTPDPAALAAAATARLMSLVEEAAAPLLHPGAAGELARLRERLPAAMAALGWLLTAGRFTVVAAEAPREAEGLPETGELLGGTIDLLLEDEQGRPALLDLKWTRSGRGYRKRLEEGRAVQLAAYAQLTGAGERAAYFLLADAHAVGPNGTMPAVERVPAPSLAATWAGVRQSRAGRAAALAEGRLRALGVFDGKRPPPDPDGAALAPEAPCNFCSFGRLCGKAAVA